MFKYTIPIFTLLTTCFYYAYGQTIVSGKIKTDDGLPLPGVSVKLKPSVHGTSTDSAGQFSLKIKSPASYLLYASAIGYHTDSIRLVVKGDSLKVNIILKENRNSLTGVVVVNKRNLTEINTNYTLGPISLAIMAGASADVAAALQTFPGAAPAGNETGFFVRGGSAAETAVIFDGMLVKNAFGSRLPDLANRSRYSVFIFDQTTFSTNGYSAEYGQALSSVLTMDTRTLPNKTSTEFSLISLGAGAAHTQLFKNSSLTLGLNYYNFSPYHEIVPQHTDWKKDPNQRQASLQYKFKTSATGMLKIYTDYSDTRLSFNIKNPNTNAKDLLYNKNKNLYINSNYQDYIAPDWKMFAGIAYNKTSETGDINTDRYNQNDDIWQQKLSFTRLFRGSSFISAGAESFQSKRQEGYAGKSRSYADMVAAGFIEPEIYLFDQLNLKSGLRFEYSAHLKKLNVSPRTALYFKPGDKSKFVLSYGIYYQKPDDSFLTLTSSLNYEKSIQYDLEYELKLSNKILRLNTFWKDYGQLTKINTPVFSGFQAYGPPIEITAFTNEGEGFAKGFDVFWKDKTSIKLTEYYISYSYVDTKRDYIDFETSARPTFAPKHTLNIVVLKTTASTHWQVSGTYTFNSGRSFYNPSNPIFMGDRTKSNHNFSLGLTHLPNWIKGFSAFNLNINNILGISNIYGYRYAYDGSRRTSILPPAKRSVLLSFLINLDGDNFQH